VSYVQAKTFSSLGLSFLADSQEQLTRHFQTLQISISIRIFMKKIYKNVSFLDDDIQMLNIAASISIDKSVSSYLLKNNIPYNIIYSNI